MNRAVIALIAILLTPVAHAQTLDRIRETGLVRVAFRTDVPPLSFIGPEGGPAGYMPRVCLAVVQTLANDLEMDLEAKFVPVDTGNRFEAITNGEADLLCGAATITLSRRELVDFSIPVFVDGAALLLQRGREATLESFDGARIGVRSNTTTEEALRTSLAKSEADVRIVTFDDHAEGVQAALEGQVAAYLADQTILVFYLLATGTADRFEVTRDPLTVEKQGLAMTRGDSDFRLAVDRALSRLYQAGEMQRFFRETFPDVEPGGGLRALYLLGPELP